ncbi:MAG: carbonic anhydrase [Deltaproteobacteria bacterium]|nr:carbonic anhydrase [Deltaproteobacteria bacterium]
MRARTRESQFEMTPSEALRHLRDGNQRFTSNLRTHRNLLQQVNDTREGQFPIATILSCIDSRTSAELIFDQGLGDVFSIRIAGTVINDDILGSMEFATKIAGSKLIVVLGHSSCGAIKGACDHVQLGNLSTLLNKIEPSVYFERQTVTDRSSNNDAFVERVAEIQVHRSVEAVVERSVVIRSLVEKSEVGLVGAYYDVETGGVRFYDGTYMCGEIKHFYLDVPDRHSMLPG